MFVRGYSRLCHLRTSMRQCPRSMSDLILGIETSCDDTGAALVTTEGEILSETLATQNHIK